ncbi:7014aee7-150a-4031-9576-535d1e4b7f01 [Thermothielavioides terrestris]|uniref:7014aee7-150a-4031-9576-535d1e4b7f01 n=1 Tax=Thermothielavioides terrestris TaxID=2587410 RepID=A0A446B8S4_9PEZI|nr:7014aee7-150a-4031-9576-535d1e4b7f01 [Thermothielavioides terrestris]
MSYPGPPGVSKPSHPSLPPRPPVTKPPSFKPAFPPTTVAAPGVSAPVYTAPAPSYPGYGPSATPAIGYFAPPAASPYAANPAVTPIGAGRGGYGQRQPGAYNYPSHSYAQQQPAYYGAAAAGGYPTPPQIRNPFSAPDSAAADYDPEMAAQIAQWQSAYIPRDPDDPANKAPAAGGRNGTGAPAAGGAPAGAGEAAAAAAGGGANASGDGTEKKKTVYREGGGKKWQDDTLLEWDPAHLRLFVGNLAGETTDDSLLKAFSRWKSVQKAKVIRDKRTNKSKGFGFVSFSDPEDFFQAAKEMNGKYIQSHPVVVHKAKTEIKPQVVKEERKGKNKNKGGGNKSGSGMGATGAGSAQAYEPHLGPMVGGGITKPGQKTKGGLKLLG